MFCADGRTNEQTKRPTNKNEEKKKQKNIFSTLAIHYIFNASLLMELLTLSENKMRNISVNISTVERNSLQAWLVFVFILYIKITCVSDNWNSDN